MSNQEISEEIHDLLSGVRAEVPGVGEELSVRDVQILAEECGADLPRLRRYLKRRLMGEPLPYILGYLTFRGRRFGVDRRVYITDPEASHLVDVVVDRVRGMTAVEGTPPLVAEVGIGCGSLGISVKLDVPGIRLVGLDLDGAALEVTGANARAHGVELDLVESDVFMSWPFERPPDLIFGDPPWGDHTSIYDDDRPIEYYLAMPAHTVFPPGGITGLHQAILRQVEALGWESEIVLNCGILPSVEVERLARMTRRHEIVVPAEGISVLHCTMA